MILLCSGGIDSIATLRLQQPDVSIYFRLETRAMNHEEWVLDWAQGQFRHTVMRSPDLATLHRWEMANGYLPYRNGLMVTFAAMHDQDVMVGQVAEWAPDKSHRYWRLLEKQLTLASQGATQGIDRHVTIHTPYAHLTKGQLLRLYADTYGEDEARLLLQATWSCYDDGPNHCGRCSGCVQRKVAEQAAGLGTTTYSDRPYLPSYDKGAVAKDAYRWVRDNRRIGGLIRRVREQRAFKS